jgi:hypothetical protein
MNRELEVGAMSPARFVDRLPPFATPLLTGVLAQAVNPASRNK